jgi:ADP-heptose:LPS heptosyltransferase
MPDNVTVISLPVFRHLWALVASSKVAVGPDSLILHLSGGFNIPSVGLWGPTDPAMRTNYYVGHTPLSSKKECAIAPCLTHRGNMPPPFCPHLNTNHCGVINGIEISDVVKEVGKKLC